MGRTYSHVITVFSIYFYQQHVIATRRESELFREKQNVPIDRLAIGFIGKLTKKWGERVRKKKTESAKE